jgi:hypothetical protein
MNTQEVITKARGHITTMGKKSDEGITSLCKREDGWTVCIEVVERKGIPDTTDILGLYEINMNNEGEFLGVERKKMRKRGDCADN